MKLVLLVFNFIYDDSVRSIMERLHLPGFTEVPRVFGAGESGKRFGTHAFPGNSTMVLTVVPEAQLEPFLREIAAFKAGITDRAKRPAGIKAFVLGVERSI